jgi:hypothetical protein
MKIRRRGTKLWVLRMHFHYKIVFELFDRVYVPTIEAQSDSEEGEGCDTSDDENGGLSIDHQESTKDMN